ncbi:MAG: bacteriophage Gp15 family protein [Muribaculum sp.]|nr:bacteriophage Gp15 family protein [Muribaculum sp.]
MFNVLVDPLPCSWNGIKMDTDYQTGILISQCMADESLNQYERFACAASLLFPWKQPPPEEIAKALKWFLTEYDHDNHAGNEKANVIVMDWDIDQWRIFAAFWQQYHIDLSSRRRMHWFVFMGLLANLEECAFVRVMNIREKEIDAKMSQQERRALKRAKKIFAIKAPERVLSASEQKRVDEFMKYANRRKEETG